MSELAKTLEQFGFLSIDDVTPESLKRSFKTRILEVHPDKGGDADLFDKMLSSYVYLTHTVQRISGGRTTLQNILSPDELKRPDEIINQFFDDFHNDFEMDFHREFEKQKKETHGYESWLKTDMTDTDTINKIDEKDFHTIFESIKPSSKQSIILHPDAMAIESNIGTALIDNETCYDSTMYSNPEYTDLYSAYITHNTIYDKVTYRENNRTFNDVIAERNADITPLDDEELIAIQEYEKKKLENDITCEFDNKGFVIRL